MTAASDSRNNAYRPGLTIEPGCDGGAQVIYGGVMACYDDSGYVVEASDTAAYVFAGVSREKVEITATETDGVIKAKLQRDGIHRFIVASVAVTDVGKPCWVSDDQTVSLTPTNVYVGTVAAYVDSTHCDVDIEPGVKLGSRRKTITVPLGPPLLVENITYKHMVYAPNRSCKIWRAKYANVVAVESNGTIAVNNQDNVSTARNVLAAATYSVSGITALTAVDLTLSSTAANLLMDEDDVLTVTLVAGSPLTTAGEGLSLTLEIEEFGLPNAA